MYNNFLIIIMEEYLKRYHNEDVTDLLNNNDDVCIYLNLSVLHQKNRDLYQKIVKNPHEEAEKWSHVLLNVQKALIEGNMFLEDGFTIKENCTVRFVNLPSFDERRELPNNEDVGKFVQIKGNIVRMTKTRLLELKREYICNKCKQKAIVMAYYEKMYIIDGPKRCVTDFCKGLPSPTQSHPKPEYCIDYQEIRVQELMSEKNMPSSMIVTLENDLADHCQPGDVVTVCGTVERRWKPVYLGKKSEVFITIRAVSVVKEEIIKAGRDLPEYLICLRAQWQDTVQQLGEINARDLILKSIAPEVHGMLLPKLAVALLLCSGVESFQIRGTFIRGHSHVLLVGDPGLAKTKLLKHASQISRRSIYTTGMGCSQAGLTAAAVREGNEWQLEAGALVLADGGICCIDEFNLMRDTDKGSIHEAMEQQSVSMAKAGVVCKLSTRCSVLAATNHKKSRTHNLYNMGIIDVGIASPLLSRFDIVLLLQDPNDLEWDEKLADHILGFQIDDNESQLMTMDELQQHFMSIKSIHPEMTEQANEVLGNYYRFCRADLARDPGRTTMRLLDSLIRLAQSHARLLFRSKVLVRDAVMVIILIESSLGFGKLLSPIDTIRTEAPMGPTNQDIVDILEKLGMKYDPQNDDNAGNEGTDMHRRQETIRTSNATKSPFFPNNNIPKSPDCLNIDFPVSNVRASLPRVIETPQPRKNKLITGSNLHPVFNTKLDLEELDEIFDLNNIENRPKKKSKLDFQEIVASTSACVSNNIGNNYKHQRKAKIHTSANKALPVEVPQDNHCNIENILGGIRENFMVTPTRKNLQLSSTQDIDLDEIFGDCLLLPEKSSPIDDGICSRQSIHCDLNKIDNSRSLPLVPVEESIRQEITFNQIGDKENKNDDNFDSAIEDNSENFASQQSIHAYLFGNQKNEDLNCLNLDF